MKGKIVCKIDVYKAIIKKIIGISRTYLLFCFIQCVLSIITPLVLLFMPTYIIDAFVNNESIEKIVLYVIITIVIPLTISLLKVTVDKNVILCAQMVEQGLDYSIDEGFVQAKYEKLEGPEIYGKTQNIREGKNMVGPITSVIQNQLFGLVSNAICIFTYIWILGTLIATDIAPFRASYLDEPPAIIAGVVSKTPVFLMIMLALSVLIVCFRYQFQEKERKRIESFSDVERKYNYFVGLRGDYDNGADIRINGLYDLLRYSMDDYNVRERKMHIALGINNSIFQTLIVFVMRLQEIFILAFIVCKILYGSISLGEFYLYTNALSKIISSIFVILQQINNIRYAMNYYGVYYDLWNIEKEEKKGSKTENIKSKIEIEFRNVSFKYPGSRQWIIQNLNLSIMSGEHIAIVGKNGVGKSTLIKLLMGLYEVQEGEIYIRGRNIKELNKDKLYNYFGTVFQDYKLLDSTIGSNISAVENEYDVERIREILNIVGLDVILGPEGEKKKIGRHLFEDGINFSGGEEQKVAIARALVLEPEVLLSDEATSALDPQNTQQILDLLKQLNKHLGLTVVLITHEMDAVKKICNKVAVMEHGKMIEKGNLRQVFLHPKKELTKRFVGGGLEAIQTLEALNLGKLEANEEVYQLVYSIANVTKSIIIELYRQIGVEVSMLYGNVELLNGEAIGTLVVLVKGDANKQKQAREFLEKQNVTLTRLDEKGNLDD